MIQKQIKIDLVILIKKIKKMKNNKASFFKNAWFSYFQKVFFYCRGIGKKRGDKDMNKTLLNLYSFSQKIQCETIAVSKFATTFGHQYLTYLALDDLNYVQIKHINEVTLHIKITDSGIDYIERYLL